MVSTMEALRPNRPRVGGGALTPIDAETSGTRRSIASSRTTYAWDVEIPQAGGSCGVTTDKGEAVDQVERELQNAPNGSHGLVRQVELNVVTPDYDTVRVISEAWRCGSETTWST